MPAKNHTKIQIQGYGHTQTGRQTKRPTDSQAEREIQANTSRQTEMQIKRHRQGSRLKKSRQSDREG